MRLKKLYQAIACASLVVPTLAVAQQTPQIEEVVVTGSLIRGTPVDAALPVEVYTAADLELSGSPTALEFAKSLSIAGPTTGEAYYFGGATLTGNVQYNLRGIGSDKTLTLFNGRRITGNTSVIPSMALSRTEILKDGAAVTYGADATGGVVNFITRDSFEGLELRTSYTAIDGTSGDYDVGVMWGFGGPDTNILLAGQWEHRSQLKASDRPFTDLPYGVNPAPWSTLTNLAGWVPRAGLPAQPGNDPVSEWGTALGLVSDYTQESCEAVGGVFVNAFSCAYNYIPYYNLVEDNDIYRLYGQVNTSVTDRMDFYFRTAYAQVFTPHSYGSPSQPVIKGPARSTGATYQLYVPSYNPYVEEFAQRTGWVNNPLYALTQGYTPITYRAFAHGGLDLYAHSGRHSTPRRIDNRYLHASTGLEGEFENEISYDFALTYNQTNARNTNPDMILYRVQQALYGFGGPNCDTRGKDTNPNRFGTQNPALAGQDGCMFYNPFASNFSGQPVYGLSNPAYDPNLQNPDGLIDWMFNDRFQETISWNVTADMVFSGMTPVELPGGTIAWAAGTQWRQTKLRQSIPDPMYNGGQPCAWPNEEGQNPLPPDDPNFAGCTPDRPGPFQFFDINTPSQTAQDQVSVFGELNLPILDNLYATAAVRYEEFTGGLSSTVYKVSGKWDVTDNLAFRTSYGTNYQAPGAGITPGNISSGVNSYTIAAGNWRGAQTFTQSGIQPEEATVWSAGAIWQSEGFTPGSDVQLIVDYFNIETENELGLLASANTIANAVFSISPGGPGAAVPTNGTALADCSHPLANRVTFNGNCVQGQTTAADFSSIRTDFGNGPGQTTGGFDIQARYSLPVGPGDLRLGLTATHINEFKLTETVLDGFVLNPGADRLGTLNFATIANAVSKWRGNFTVNYAMGDHNFRGVINYISGVKDDRFFDDDGNRVGDAALTPNGLQPGTNQPFGPTLYGVHGKDWISLDLHYVVDLPWATLNASIVNVEDRMPPASRQELGYDPRIGNPLGRTFQIGLRRTF